MEQQQLLNPASEVMVRIYLYKTYTTYERRGSYRNKDLSHVCVHLNLRVDELNFVVCYSFGRERPQL